MNLRFVEAFHWAAALKSVTAAAQKLHITQSALSSRIAALENDRAARADAARHHHIAKASLPMFVPMFGFVLLKWFVPGLATWLPAGVQG